MRSKAALTHRYLAERLQSRYDYKMGTDRRAAPRRRATTAVAVLGVGAAVSLTGGPAGFFAEFPAFALVSLCAFFFSSRPGVVVVVTVMTALSLLSNHDISTASGPTGRAIGFGVAFVLLGLVAVVGVVVDLVVGFVWRSARPPAV
jgi:hypothetical protein